MVHPSKRCHHFVVKKLFSPSGLGDSVMCVSCVVRLLSRRGLWWLVGANARVRRESHGCKTMHTSLDEVKTTQAAAYLLGSVPGSMFDRYRKLVRLMYLADREAIAKLGFSITHGKHWSLPDGPVVSEVNDLLSDSAYEHKYTSSGYWDTYIACTRESGVAVLKNPGTGRLSAAHIRILKAIRKRYGSMSDDELGKVTHALPEYDEIEEGERPKKIAIERTLESGGFEKGKAERIAQEVEARDWFRELINQ